MPLNKLPTLDKKFNWNNATNSLGAVLERKVEDITLREVLSSGSVVRKQTGLTYQQAVSRQQAMLRAEQRFQQSYTAQVRKDMVNRVLRLVRMRTDTVAEADDIHSGYYYRFRSSKGIALWGGDPFKACVYLSATPFTLKDTMYSQYFQSYVAILDISGITVVVGLSDSYVCRMRWYGYGDPY